ncbi:metallophosphoesterase [Methylobacterium sp. E-005]|uniref:metallophosphoesterase n=1 Tax=Methylobacterium sp. E-005 TaxID=2836549 RepID=UPI001FBB1A71|nr:metallophosphoesterase [Methylobacterium sp. E-005]MCJ2087007.1 metallophosphoesterase [Methylobacterium sp. E-005]
MLRVPNPDTAPDVIVGPDDPPGPGMPNAGASGRSTPDRPDAGGVRLWVLSDLRVDRIRATLPDPPPDFDALLVAGNLSADLDAGLDWLAGTLGGGLDGRPVIVVPGSAEFEGGPPTGERLDHARAAARAHGFRLLSDESTRVEVPDRGVVHVLGATLWTDWCLAGAFEGQLARIRARRAWALPGAHPGPPPGWSVHDALAAHALSRAYLEDALAGIVQQGLGLQVPPDAMVPDVRAGDRAVVVTHHAPSRRCLPDDWAGWDDDCWLAASYASDLEAVMRAWGAPAAWVHGAVPAAVDVTVGRTRIVANPRGGADPRPGFDPGLVIVV